MIGRWYLGQRGSILGLFSTWFHTSQPRDSQQRARVPHPKGRSSTQSPGHDGAGPTQADIHQCLQAAERDGETQTEDRQIGASRI